MQEKLDALVRTQAMQLFRQQGLHFTMQQVAEPLHISKKTIYTTSSILAITDNDLWFITLGGKYLWLVYLQLN